MGATKKPKLSLLNDRISIFKTQYTAIPDPLKKQFLVRLGLAFVFLLLSAFVLWAMFDWLAVVPLICLAVFSAIRAYILFSQAVAGEYVIIRGRCAEVTVTPIRKRSKSILVQTDEHVVRLMMRQRPKRIPVGVDLEIYVAANTPVHEKDGADLIHTYLAIDRQSTAPPRERCQDSLIYFASFFSQSGGNPM